MKTITLTLAALFCATGSFAAEDGKTPAISVTQPIIQEKLGKDAIFQLREAYEEGQYETFLKEMDASYQELADKNQLASLAEMRLGITDDSKWTEAAKLLQAERNTELNVAIGDQDSLFAQQVRSVAADLPSPEEDQAISRISAFRQMLPTSGKNVDENALIDLDLEYQYKSLHLDMPLTQGEQVDGLREKHYVLRMEKMDKMRAIAQTFEDVELKQAIELTAQNQDARMAQNWDQAELNAYLKGKKKPADTTQNQVVNILEAHQEKLRDLTKNYLESQGNSHATKK